MGAAAEKTWQVVSDPDNLATAGKVLQEVAEDAVPGVLAVKGGIWLSDPDNRAKVGRAYDKAKAWEASLTDYERKTLLGRAKFEIAALFLPIGKAGTAAKAAELAKGTEVAADGMRLLGEVKTGAKAAEAAGEGGKVEELLVELKKCFTEGHPVDVASGLLFTQATDFSLPGPLPLVWSRTWLSRSTHQGALGYGWHHDYDLGLTLADDGGATLRLADGRQVVFAPPVAPGERSFNRRNQMELVSAEAAGAPPRVWNITQRCWYMFEAAGSAVEPAELRLRAVEDRNGFAIRFAYSPAGHLSRITDSADRLLPCDTDAAGRLLAIHAPDPHQAGATFALVRYAYDEAGDLTTVTDALGYAARFAYEGHLLTRETFRSGLNFYFEYDGDGPGARCVHTWGDGGIYDTRLRYDAPGQTTVWNSYGHQKTYFHRQGLVRRLVDALGAEQRWDYNQYAELEATRDPLGQLTRYDYDGRGQPTSTTYPDGAQISTQYDAQGRPNQGTDANGGTWQWQYDEAGRLVAETDPVGVTTRYTHDAQGRLTTATDALGQTIRLRYDAQGRLSHVVAPDGSIRSRAYNALWQLVELTDARGHVERRHYDRLGQLTGVQAPEGMVRRFAYDAEGNIIRADDGRQPVEFVYTSMGQLAARRQGGQAMQFTYDREGNLTGLVNEHDETYTFTLDATGQVVEEVGFDGLTRRYVRDAAGRVTQVLRPGGRTTAYTYDEADRIAEVLHNGNERISYQYRADGALLEARTADNTVQFERGPRGQVLREVQNGHEVRSSYNQMGQRVGVSSSLGANISFERDALGQVRRTQAGPWQSVVERDAEGLELHRQLSGGLRTSWQRDALGRPTSQRLAVSGQEQRRRYQWQGADQLVEVEDSQHGISQYSYDDWGNLAGARFGDGRQELRQPDAVGNLFRTRERSDRRYGKGGQLREANGTRYKYDEEGNLTRKTLPDGEAWYYAWDGAGQLIKVTRPDGYAVTFTYDALGRRVSKRFRGRVTKWVWDGDKPLHEWHELEVGPGAGAAQDLATWLFEDDSFAPAAKLTAKGSYSVVCDHLGTPLSMYDGQGQATWEMSLDSYGGVRQGRGKAQDCPFRYQGQYEDTETGLYYNRFRYYDPEVGSYISQDPAGLDGGYEPYTFVRDTNSRTDVLGLAEGGFVYGLHPAANDVAQKGVHFGSNAVYPNGNKVEVSLRPNNTGGITLKPSHPGQVKTAKDMRAFEQGAAEVEQALRNPKTNAKVIEQIENLYGMFPEKGKEWKMLKEALKRLCPQP